MPLGAVLSVLCASDDGAIAVVSSKAMENTNGNLPAVEAVREKAAKSDDAARWQENIRTMLMLDRLQQLFSLRY